MEINFGFTVLCDKDHLKKLQHLLIDEEYEGILEVISSESEYEIQNFKGEVVDPNKINTITIPYKQNDSTITIPKIVPCDGTVPINLNECIDHLYRPGQIRYEMNTEPAENTIALYTTDESDIYSAEGSSDLPDDVNFSSTPDDFHYSPPITNKELKNTKVIDLPNHLSFDNTIPNDEVSKYEFADLKSGSIKKYSIEAKSLSEAIRWYEATNCVELVLIEWNGSSLDSIALSTNKDILRIEKDKTIYYFYERKVCPYYIIMDDKRAYYRNYKSDLTGKDIDSISLTMKYATKFTTIEDAKKKIDELFNYEEYQNKDFTIIKCIERAAEIHCGDSNFINFADWHYKCEKKEKE